MELDLRNREEREEDFGGEFRFCQRHNPNMELCKIVPGVTLSDGTRLHYRCNEDLSCCLRLLYSALLGLSRHCNYLGDMLKAPSVSLPCRISSSPVSYFYPVYFLTLLIWRERERERE
ncbi:hypothetical protein NE237_008829 [Protea cynaroides]|uniref:Uncharacterized protein n=1 Tax=Protea cynaroides TaxID=273540 RepID=A0A9Q0KWT1_9MAGN|nr:hypothetical protein NE237_008829 [Protea cynaroides]